MRTSVLVTMIAYCAFPLIVLAQHNHGQHSDPPAAQAPAHDSHQGHDHAAMQAVTPSPAVAASGAVKQTTCPVTGEPIKADSFMTYNGQKVFFCCDDCIAKFKQAPAKYLAVVYKQTALQSVQTKCPVMGGTPKADVSVVYKGQTVSFCCGGCDTKFQNDPAKYAVKLKDSFTSQVHDPVTGNPIDLAQKLEERGRTVYFDSKESLAKYRSEPAKYAKALLPEVGIVAYGPTAKDDVVTCPVCPAGKAQHQRAEVQPVVYQGKVYFLFSEACAKAFKADPGKYARALDNAVQPKSPTPAGAHSAVAPTRNLLSNNWDDTGHAQHQLAAGHEGHGGGGHGCGGCQ